MPQRHGRGAGPLTDGSRNALSNLNALLVAVDVAVRKRDEARRLLQDAQGSQQAAQDQLDQLQGYARETEGRWGLRADAAVQDRKSVV